MDQDTMILLVSVAGFLSGLTSVLGHLFMHFALKARGVQAVRVISSTPLYPLILYARYRKQLRSSGLDALALITVVSTAMLIAAFALSVRLGIF